MKINRDACSPRAMLTSIMGNRDLIWQLAKSEIIGRYRGSMLGIFWSFVIPLLMILVYTFVFSYIFKARWSGETGSKAEFSIFLFSGLTIYSLFSECVLKAPSLIISNVNYVKRVVFPLEILVLVSLLSSLFHFGLSTAVLLLFYFVIHLNLHWTIVYLPLILLPLILFTVGISWILASLGTYVRDVGQSVGILTTVLLFMSPIFYPASVLPQELRPYLFLNPLTFIIEQFRDILIFGNSPAWTRLGIYTLICMSVATAGFYWFQKTRKGFADVL
ncbi:teichoic acid translocation permease protein TagG [mine drainage metagenome]|uniref:Teichoic acid translocation permease protein TagG n=1 Tax=mine drainage metagenome TaxID=410659 RepID=A0A1J5Q810_9ZZZZ